MGFKYGTKKTHRHQQGLVGWLNGWMWHYSLKAIFIHTPFCYFPDLQYKFLDTDRFGALYITMEEIHSKWVGYINKM